MKRFAAGLAWTVVLVIAVTFITGVCTGGAYGWGADHGGGDLELWAGTNNSYCYVDFSASDAGCEHAN